MSKLIFIASIAYIISSGLLIANMRGYRPKWGKWAVMLLATLASGIHGALLWSTFLDDSVIHMGLGVSLSLAGWLSAVLVIASSLQKPMESLGVIIFPVALASLWLAPILPPPHILAFGIGLHVIASLIAFTLLGLAAAQAALILFQEKRLRERKWHGLLGALPPLALMEVTLFEWLVASFIMLSFALITGAIFVDNLLAQHLAHKTLFTLLSWLLLAILIWAHYKYGWRGQKAARLVLWGYGLLVLGYAGSQFVLEVVLA
ncbi:MAG: cytochrome c biogenesis protein CcsA [Thiotrichales bacterium]|jgi:ABC-type uncharacterized transport system permease subunit|nr:cytochrome c biogenesis protein CcsA [Thiotrichales bacterium]